MNGRGGINGGSVTLHCNFFFVLTSTKGEDGYDTIYIDFFFLLLLVFPA